MASVHSPLRYPGGKNKTYEYVKSLVQQNDITTYIEPFAGGAAVALRLLINKDVKKIIINDYDRSIYAIWYSILYHTEELIDRINNTDITIYEWHKQREIQNQKEHINLLDLGFSTLFLNRTNRSGIIKAGVIGGLEQNGNYLMDCRFNKETIIKRISNIADHSANIKICNFDAIDFIREEIKKTRKSLTFFDPPYYKKGPALYTNFYTHEDHKELAWHISQLMRNRYWILTYDISEEIKEMYAKYNYEPTIYYLNYSIAQPTRGQEFMFFSRNTVIGNIEEHLKIV